MRAFSGVVATLCLGAVLWAGPATAHPHMFVDAQSRLLADESGRVTGLRTNVGTHPFAARETFRAVPPISHDG